MADGKDRSDWSHTSHLLAKLHNVNVTDEADLLSAEDFYPFDREVEDDTPATDEDRKRWMDNDEELCRRFGIPVVHG